MAEGRADARPSQRCALGDQRECGSSPGARMCSIT
jgi:hypothetical protein